MKPYRLLSTLFLTLLAIPVAHGFTDVEEQHPHHTAIIYLQTEGVIQGYDDATYRPEIPVNRAEFLKILIEAEGDTPDEETYQGCFTDIKEEWFAKYICYAKEQGWVEGYIDGSFRPGQSINKVEALKMLLEVQGFQEQSTTVDTKNLYQDTAAGEWYARYVSAAKSMNFLIETGELYLPGQAMTRGNIAEIVFRSSVMRKGQANSYTETLYTPSTPAENTTEPTEETVEESTPEETTEEPTEETPTETSTEAEDTRLSKTPYEGTPPITAIALQGDQRIVFQELSLNGRTDTYATLANTPTTPLDWASLQPLLQSPQLTLEQFAAIVELLEYQHRVGPLGRYSSIELLGGSIATQGHLTVEITSSDLCYGSITRSYQYNIQSKTLTITILDQTEALYACK